MSFGNLSWIHRFCGEEFRVIENKNFGKCFEQLCLSFPTLCLLIIFSSYYAAFGGSCRLIGQSFRCSLLLIRFLISLCLSSVGLYELYCLYFDTQHFSSSDLILAVQEPYAWLTHAIYLLLFHISFHRTRGPFAVNISAFLCFAIRTLLLYSRCNGKGFECLTTPDILVIVCQLAYICALLPSDCVRNSVGETSINSLNPEEEPLLNSAASRYNAFREESDPEDLGTAEECNYFSDRLFFMWVKPLMLKGLNHNLKTVDDLFDLPESLQPDLLSEKIFEGSVASDSPPLDSLSLIKRFHSCFGFEFYCIGVIKLISDCLLFGGPVLLNALVSNLEDPESSDPNNGYYFALGLFLTSFLGAICSTHYNYIIARISLKIKASLLMIVYQKTLSASKMTLSSMSTGEILNFISTDTDRIVNFCQSFHQFWSLLVQIIIALVMLYQQLNFYFLIGVVFMLIVIPINQYIARKIAHYSSHLMQWKDRRIMVMNEILGGIRTIKMNTWEKIFIGKVNVARKSEVKYLKKRKYLDALCVYFWATSTVIMSFLTFALYSSLGYALTAAKVFTSISLFNILIMPLNAFPWVLNGLMEAWVSFKRLDAFIQLPSLKISECYSLPDQGGVKLELVNAVFSHKEEAHSSEPSSGRMQRIIESESSFVLGPLSLEVSQGNFVCIIGKVGSGKSSLLAGLLADMKRTSGEIKMDIAERHRGIGYVSQSPWIQQKSIKDNILFGKNFNSFRYRSILESCALVEDLKTLPFGDNTKVGDKGVTLSGGQKARIALARAVYQDFDIYLLDDPLSAVDSHVADHIFSNCIMGLLKTKTRILCTHKTKFAENADQVVVLSGGKVKSLGPPSQALQLYFMNEELESSDEFEDSKKKFLKDSICEKQEQRDEYQEEKEEGVVKLHVFKSYWKAVGTALSVSVLVFCFLMQASKTVSDWWMSYWVSSLKNNSTDYLILDRVEMKQENTLAFYLSVYGGLALSNTIFALFRAFLFAIAGIEAAVVLHDKLLYNIVKAKTFFFDTTPLGQIINRFSSDVYCIDDSLPFTLNILLAQAFSLVGSVFITCFGLPWILVLIVVLSFLYFKIQNYYRNTSRELKRLSTLSLSPIYSHFSETLHGHSTIRAMSSSTKFQKDNMDYIDCNLRTMLSMAAASQWLNLRLQFIGVVIVSGVALTALIQREFGDVNAGLVGLSLSYALSITSLLNGSITAFTETEKEIVSVERVVQYIENVEIEDNSYVQLPPFAWPSHGVISFVNVSLRYKPTCGYALKNVSFETKPGEKIGIVGRTGSGKSSLIQVLCRMVNCFEGAVFVDGVNISNLELKRLRSSFSVIPQDPFLFSGSVRENLDPYYIRSDPEIWKALKYCHMEQKLQTIGGLDVRIEETGRNFSNGEKQLLCLARALLQRAKILCMDEATANIDFHTDSLIRHTVRMAFRHSTTLIIAHRIETVMDCDRVLVMKNGEIAEYDKPSSLLSDSESEFYGFVYSKTN